MLSWPRPPNGVLTMVGFLASKEHKTMHYADTDECMVSQSKSVDAAKPGFGNVLHIGSSVPKRRGWYFAKVKVYNGSAELLQRRV